MTAYETTMRIGVAAVPALAAYFGLRELSHAHKEGLAALGKAFEGGIAAHGKAIEGGIAAHGNAIEDGLGAIASHESSGVAVGAAVGMPLAAANLGTALERTARYFTIASWFSKAPEYVMPVPDTTSPSLSAGQARKMVEAPEKHLDETAKAKSK